MALEKNFGQSFKVFERAIAKNFYLHLMLEFVAKGNYSLKDYIEEAKGSLQDT